MKRRRSLQRKTAIKRTATPMRKTPLAPRSAKMTETYERAGGRRDIVAAMLADGALCEAGPIIGVASHAVACAKFARDVHEILPRSAGGSIVEATNLLRVCRACHRWIHTNPKAARAMGLLASRGQTK